MSALGRIRGWLEKPLAVWMAVGFGLVLTLPTLAGGFYFDDYFLKLALLGHPSSDYHVAPWDLFSFIKAGSEEYELLLDRFIGLWGATEGFQIAFFRPLSSMTHALDFWLWPEAPWMMHLQSVIWYGVLILLASILYRRFMGATWVAGLAMVLYAIDDAHGMTVGWISNRNALVAGVFGVVCLLAHDRWRRDGWRWGRWLGPLMLVLALTGGESGIAVCGYLAAYALILDRGTWRERVSSLVSYVLVVVIWRILYTAMGYGVAGTDLYVDPAKEPFVFSRILLERLPVLLLGQFALPPSEVWLLVTDEGRLLLTWIGVAALSVILLLIFPMLKQYTEMRFFGLGALLATIPISAVFPFDRLLIFTGIGAMALVAGFVGYLVDHKDRPPWKVWTWGAHGLVAAWLVIHVAIAPLLLPGRALLPTRLDRIQGAVGETYPRDEAVTRQTLVVVNSPDIGFGFHVLARNAALREPLPAYVRFLSISDTEVIVEREDEQSLSIRWPTGLFRRPVDRFYRGTRFPFAVGDSFPLTGFVARVTAVMDDGRPAAARFEFRVPLEDSSLRWVSWNGRGYAPFVLPQVGEAILLPPANLDELL